MNPMRNFVWAFAALLLMVPSLLQSEEIDFNREIRPILSDKCFACHGPDANQRKADLRLDQRESAVESAILPGKAKESELLLRLLSEDPEKVMPPPHVKKKLQASEIELIRKWIDQGAPYAKHWAFQPLPTAVKVPNVVDAAGWVRHAIDSFVLKEGKRMGLQPAPEATREQWLRRVTFDLTGLPPSIEEIDQFLSDRSEDAYEKVVDRLFRETSYGERMAADWLDAARYADTFGYQADREMHVWPWRDWVIRAFQQNLPYDKFLRWQLAGDLEPDPTADQRMATTFNRLHRQTNEGGSIEEEFRIEYVSDRVRTMGTAILGLTLECSRCHDHKYDPISQRDYYRLTAFFNNIDEHGLYSHFTETAPTPAMLLYEGDQEKKHRELLAHIAGLERTFQERLSKGKGDASAATSAKVEVPVPDASFDFEQVASSGDYVSVEGRRGKALQFGGDDAFTCKGAPTFTRPKPFSLSLWVRPHAHDARMVVAHQSRAAEDAAFRGFSFVLDRGYPVVSLIHFWPGNAIQVRSQKELPIERWSHVVITYDGSSRAEGLSCFVDGEREALIIVRDRLTRDFTHRSDWGDSDVQNTPLALGARFRDVGFKGGKVDDLLVFAKQLTRREVRQLYDRDRLPSPETKGELIALESPSSNEEQIEHDVLRNDEEGKRILAELEEKRVEENEFVSKIRQIMVMEEMSRRRPTYLLARGAYDARTDEVTPDVLRSIFDSGKPLALNRRGLADWLLDPSHPLTSRVAVNRYWRIFFGRGLVATSEDFGNQGETPSHPELLDYLARDLVDNNWDIQRLCKQIVLSATYRQDSTHTDSKSYLMDPSNRWLLRGPRHRWTAEQLRDNALAVSGLLDRRVGGKSVYPYQPAGLWEESGTGKKYTPSKGKDLYRKSMYSFWRRTSPPPSMTTFDAPSREFCLARRESTATPLQALTLLNDPQFVEAARVLAERLLKEEADESKRIERGFRLMTSRRPSPRELELLTSLYREECQRFENQLEAAKKFVAIGDAVRDETLPLQHVAAMTIVMQALMSFDECVTKR